MAKKKRGKFALSPIRSIMKKNGAEIVSRQVILLMALDLEDRVGDITKKALKLVQNSKRKKITEEDYRLALEL